MSAAGGRLRGSGKWPLEPCCQPHLADTRLGHPTPASAGTLEGNLGTLRRENTRGLGGCAVIGLKWVARSAAAYLESSPGGGLSL